MLKQRLITAIVLLAIFMVTLITPQPEYFGVLTLVFIAIAGWEWSRLNGVGGIAAYVHGAIVGIVCILLYYFEIPQKAPTVVWLIAGGAWVVGAPIVLKGGEKCWVSIPRSVRWGLGILVLCMAWAALWSAKLFGNNFLLSVLFMVWIADTGAYFGGKTFGKRKLAPSISPGKSWEGAVSGALCVLILAGIWTYFDLNYLLNDISASFKSVSFFTHLSIFSSSYGAWGIFIMGFMLLFLTAMSVVGDLFESLMKRSAGMKDSSNLLPGHGGVLDRVDALLPVLPLCMAAMSMMTAFASHFIL